MFKIPIAILARKKWHTSHLEKSLHVHETEVYFFHRFFFAVQYIITNTLCCHLVIPVTNLKHDPNTVLYIAPSGEKVSDHNLKMPLRRKVKTLKHSCLHNITKDIDSHWCKDYTENYPEGGNKYMHVVGPFDDIRKLTLIKN